MTARLRDAAILDFRLHFTIEDTYYVLSRLTRHLLPGGMVKVITFRNVLPDAAASFGL